MFFSISKCWLFSQKVSWSSDAPVWQEHRPVACRRTKSSVFLFLFSTPPADQRLLQLHDIINQDDPQAHCFCCVWTKMMLVIFFAFIFVCVCFHISKQAKAQKGLYFYQRVVFRLKCVYCTSLVLTCIPLFIQEKKGIFRTVMQPRPKKAPLLSSVCVRVCVSVNARVHASIWNGLIVCVWIGFSSLS